MQERGALRWSHEWSSDPLSSCLVTACFYCMLPPCIVDVYTFTRGNIVRVLYILGQSIGSMILPIVYVLYCRRHHGKTMIATLLLFSSCGKNHFENLQGKFMVDFLDGEAWAILGGHIISAQGQSQPHMYYRGREECIGMKQQNSPFSPITLHRTGGKISIWMIAWVSGSSVGLYFPHAYLHS